MLPIISNNGLNLIRSSTLGAPQRSISVAINIIGRVLPQTQIGRVLPQTQIRTYRRKNTLRLHPDPNERMQQMEASSRKVGEVSRPALDLLSREKTRPIRNDMQVLSASEVADYQNQMINKIVSEKEMTKGMQIINKALAFSRCSGKEVAILLAKRFIKKDDQTNSPNILSEHPEKTSKEIKEKVARDQKFEKDLKKIFNSSLSDIEKAKELEEYLYKGNRIEHLDFDQLKKIYMTFWDLGAYDRMVEMMLQSENETFITNPLIVEFMARAMQKGHYINLYIINALAEMLIKYLPNVEQGLSIKGISNVIAKDAAINLSRAIEAQEDIDDFLFHYNQCFPGVSSDINIVRKNYQTALSKSTELFLEVFQKTRDCRYGRLLMHCMLEKGDLDVQKYARLTQLAAIKEGGILSENFSVVRAYLETLYILPESDPAEIAKAQRILFSLCVTASQIENVMLSFGSLNIVHPQLDEFKVKIALHAEKFKKNARQASEIVEQEKALITGELKSWQKYAYNYAGLNSNFIAGNFKFGAQLPNHTINRTDISFFLELLDKPLIELDFSINDQRSLMDIKNFDEFDQLVNFLIRSRFQTKGLERLDSEEHKIYDEKVNALIALAGAPTAEDRKALPDSRTNISSTYIIGLGDCRHHAQIKQMLFDLWRGKQLNEVINQLEKAYNANDLDQVKLLMEKFESIKSVQLFTLDLSVSAPISIKNYHPEWHNNQLVLDRSRETQKVEEHTLNILVVTDPKTKEVKGQIRDSFYHNTYPWQNLEIDIEQLSKESDISAGEILLYDAENQLSEFHTVQIRPTAYAGRRAEYNRGSESCRVIGQPIKQFSVLEAIQATPYIQQHIVTIAKWHKETEKETADKAEKE